MCQSPKNQAGTAKAAPAQIISLFPASATAPAVSAAALFPPKDMRNGRTGAQEDHTQQDPIAKTHSKPPIWYTSIPASHATPHCRITTPSIFQNDLSSRRMAATAATHGVYKSVNTRNDNADSGVNKDPSTDPKAATLVPSSTPRVDTTASLAVKPEISAVATRQSSKPRGLKIPEMN